MENQNAAPQFVMVSPSEYKRQQVVQSMIEAQELKLDTTDPGGKFLVNGEEVDANGRPFKAGRTEHEVQFEAENRFLAQQVINVNPDAEAQRIEADARIADAIAKREADDKAEAEKKAKK